MYEKIKKQMGIEIANCESCQHLGHDSAGSDDPCEPSWPICTKKENERFNNLKSFPFTKEMPCWTPEFWHSKFAGMIKTGSKREMNKLGKMFCDLLEA